MAELNAHGLAVRLPPGWEGTIYRRPEENGERTFPILHAANFGLPAECGDYGGEAVEVMGPDDAFLALLEFGPDGLGSAAFAEPGLPATLEADAFHADALHCMRPGRAGFQRFFHEAGRTFGLYAVLGDGRRACDVVPAINQVLATIRIDEFREESPR